MNMVKMWQKPEKMDLTELLRLMNLIKNIKVKNCFLFLQVDCPIKSVEEFLIF